MTTIAHTHNMVIAALDQFDVPVGQIRDDDPPPLTTWHQMLDYTRTDYGFEAWFIDIVGVRNHVTGAIQFQTEGGMIRVVEEVDITGWFGASDVQDGDDPHDIWERAYAAMFDRCVEIGLTISANRRVDDLTNLAQWSFTIENRQIGEMVMLEARFKVLALRHAVP